MIDPSIPVATLVLDHSECAAVLARHHIDYCCRGKRPLAEACADHGLDVSAVLGELETAIARRDRPALDPRALSTRDVITKVIAPHHQYLHRTMPFLRGLAAKVARVHGDREPSLREVSRLVDTLVETLAQHLEEEETELFPALLRERPADVQDLLLAMRAEHDEVGAMLEALRIAAAGYAPPEWACNSYRTLMSELEEMEADTLKHVHVENHVLLPRYVPAA